MRTQISTAGLALVATAASAVATAAPVAEPARKGEPPIEQMVVFRDGAEVAAKVAAKRTTAAVGRRSCAIAAATPLAALLATPGLGKMKLYDYGSCSSRPADSSGLFVRAIRGERNRGLDGWVYKVGRRLGTAGAADPAGPFGSGRLRARTPRGTKTRVLWFYCQFEGGSCQHSLELELDVDGREAAATVFGYDDAGKGTRVPGARISVRGRPDLGRTTGSDGEATLTFPARGTYALRAAKRDPRTGRDLMIRSFRQQVTIR
jgi:hypothetical protein